MIPIFLLIVYYSSTTLTLLFMLSAITHTHKKEQQNIIWKNKITEPCCFNMKLYPKLERVVLQFYDLLQRRAVNLRLQLLLCSNFLARLLASSCG
jgi:transposase